ncbi:hypothetical protein EIP91_006536 [Steccherinum ochraceum]|uniref:Uncharacterized protein n=1 Tax=Steccherinum ochraceum TaxID=92696 RepID=A0A4R0R5K7_9APHY|nr:hypothetical protein EIP91_006536 [Steccherinum ochraceum]
MIDLLEFRRVEVAVVIDDSSTDWTVDIGPNIPFLITLSDSNDNNSTAGPLTTKAGTQTCDLVAGSLDGSVSSPDSQPPATSSRSSPTDTTPQQTPTSPYHNSAVLSNTTPSPSNSAPPDVSVTGDSKSSGVSGTTLGIAIAAVLVCIGIIAGLIIWLKRRHRRRKHPQIDLLDEGKFDPSMLEAQVIQPFTGSKYGPSAKPEVVMVERPAEGSTGGRVLVAQFNEPYDSDPSSQQTYSEKVAAMRPRKGREPSFNTVRLESVSDGSSQISPSHAYPPSSSTGYPIPVSSTTSARSSSSYTQRRTDKIHLDVATTPSIRSAASEEAATPTNESTTSLIHQQGPSRREADGGIRLAGGPRQSWNIGGGTLPPAYGDF